MSDKDDYSETKNKIKETPEKAGDELSHIDISENDNFSKNWNQFVRKLGRIKSLKPFQCTHRLQRDILKVTQGVASCINLSIEIDEIFNYLITPIIKDETELTRIAFLGVHVTAGALVLMNLFKEIYLLQEYLAIDLLQYFDIWDSMINNQAI